MHPVLFRLGAFEASSYGVALAIAFAAGIAVAVRRARERGLSGVRVFDASLWILVSSLIGARGLFVFTHAHLFRPPAGSWQDALDPFHADGRFGIVGLSMWGGVVVATAVALAYFAWQRLPILAYADLLAPSVLLGEGITRIGCFLNGCCHGIPSAWPLAVRFPEGSAAALRFDGAALHPTQLYASALALTGCAALFWLSARRPRDGIVFAAFLIWIAGARIGLDFVRYHEASEILWRSGDAALTLSQAICAVGFLGGVLGLAGLARRSRSRRHRDP